MAHLIVLLAPSGPTSPDETQATFTEAATWFAQAEGAAPDEIAADFSNYAAAYDEYAHFLSTVGFNLDAVFATPEGQQLAIDTSHTMPPPDRRVRHRHVRPFLWRGDPRTTGG